jgi:hypothetical protein
MLEGPWFSDPPIPRWPDHPIYIKSIESFALLTKVRKGGQRVGRKVTAVTTGNRNRQYSCGL